MKDRREAVDKYIETILEKVSSNEISELTAYSLIKEFQKATKNSYTLSSIPQSGDVAIIGMACRFPQARTKDEYWGNLVNGVDCIKDFPKARLSAIAPFLGDRALDEESLLKAGYLDRIDTFDADFFSIFPGEAKYIDPQQRIFLETAYEAIEDAGYGGKRIINTNTGVYVGYSENKYGELIKEKTPAAFVGNFAAIIPGRLSYIYNLSGPSVSIATACSSSLVSLHMACEGLKLGDCDMAVAGGINLTILPGKKNSGGLAITSPDGRSKAFDASADGTGWGEGSGVVLLKPLAKALEDKDYIYAVIKGSAINQDGASNEISSPKASAQTEVIIKAWKHAGVDPNDISYIEAHGTGTKIGDPIEIKGITDAFSSFTTRKQFCAIGSVKSNIGHLDSCSGMAGLIKTVMALRAKLLPPTLHFKSPNPLANLYNSPLYINTKLGKWDSNGSPRRAGISSFGLSGTNCHMIIEEYTDNDENFELPEGDFIFTLSAKTKESLMRLIQKYIGFLTSNTKYSLPNICYTANTGRGHYNSRVAIIARDCGELLEKLYKISSCNTEDLCNFYELDKRVYFGFYEKQIETISFDILEGNEESTLDTLVRKYISGQDIDWDKFFNYKKLNKIPLPVYQYEEKSYWIEYGDSDKKDISDLGDIILKGKEDNLEYNENEKKLAYIWSEILGTKSVDINDNFFELGGDSLLATEIVTKASKLFNIELSLTEVFKYPTIKQLALIMKNDNTESLAIRPADKKSVYPLSAAQTRQYILEQITGSSTSYNMPVVLLVEGELDIDRFKNAFDMLVKRHETLRTSFIFDNGEIVQKVYDNVKLNVECYDGHYNEIDRIIEEFIVPFELNVPPLVRVKLIKLKEGLTHNGKYLFLFDMHHIISDGVSMEIIIREFGELYLGIVLTPLKIQYKDYAVWHNAFLKSSSIAKQKEYWTELFKDCKGLNSLPVLDMPVDYKRPDTMDFEGGVVEFVIESGVVSKAKKLAVDNNASLYIVLLAAYNVLLNKYTGQEDIIVGALLAGRRYEDLGNIIGLFTNFLPIRNFPKGNLTFLEFLLDVRKRTLKAYDNQDVPFQEIVNMLLKNNDPSRNPVFDTMLILHNQGDRNTEIKVGNLLLRTYNWKKNSSTIDFKLDLFHGADGELQCSLEYSRKLFEEQTMICFAKHYLEVIKGIINDPSIKLEDMYVLSDEEKGNLKEKRRNSYLNGMEPLLSNVTEETETIKYRSENEIKAEEIQKIRPRPNLPSPYVAPSNELEHTIEKVCSKVLGVDKMGINDNFFELGGNSLLAVKCIKELNVLLSRNMPPVSLFQKPTISALISLLLQNVENPVGDQLEKAGRSRDRRNMYLKSRQHLRQNHGGEDSE